MTSGDGMGGPRWNGGSTSVLRFGERRRGRLCEVAAVGAECLQGLPGRSEGVVLLEMCWSGSVCDLPIRPRLDPRLESFQD